MASNICNVCIGQKFASTEASIIHATEYHGVFSPDDVQEFINADPMEIRFFLNKILGENKFEWIKIPNHSPFCHGCDLAFSSWHNAVAHAIANHKIGNDYAICQTIGKNLLTLIPEIRKQLYNCIYCPLNKVFQFKNSLKHHLMAYHRQSEIDASTMANAQDVIEENN